MGLALCLSFLIGGCGGSDEPASATRTQPARVTPIPTAGAPVPSPTAGIHASPTATATPTATTEADTGGAEAGEDTGGAAAGDESPIAFPVEVRVSEGRITAEPDTVPAFLPLRAHILNTLDREITVVVMLPDGEAAARVDVAAKTGVPGKVKGLQPGTAEVLSPDMDPDATAILKIERGG
jgi:hypothetical protein